MASRKLQVTLSLLALFISLTHAFSWRAEKKPAQDKPSSLSNRDLHLQNIFTVALNELQELESEPLCHRVAARLLVNNCQLIDGKDEATILTDSGRQVRDFVDSYAASLAICDLERGSFVIPRECAKFRENSLSQIAIRSHPQLHVSPNEIGFCLSALAASDAAWSTWISYRHKALRFCEAARGDNERAQSILVYQKITKAIAKLAEGVESELQKRMDELDTRVRQTSDNIGQLYPHIEQLRIGLAQVENYLSKDLNAKLRNSSQSAQRGLENAENLQQLLASLFVNLRESSAELATAHEVSIKQASVRANDELGALVAVVANAAASSMALEQQLKLSNEQAASLGQRQDALEEGFERLLASTKTMASDSEAHAQVLKIAANITNDLLDTLEVSTATVESLTQSLGTAGVGHWWSFIFYPAVTLVLGSYGLEPSMTRNLALIAIGEAIAFITTTPSFDLPGREYFTKRFAPVGDEEM
ncbi:nuclear fusion protein KAR5 [Echria macrotheca]|uniref:Nuclear fusion protein KAR5 n=1 Tax=Echria macrotheca TaxID=438768 RepID=A0AAJ0BJY4_9PEZI|nr:nuclear fusion protein KAR5 [Echria macrotheca]